MKPKTVQYSIQDPCHEPWNEMQPEASGRFCGSCEKSVIDFSGMSDFSIVNYFETHKNEKVCGRFTKSQLDRVYRINQPVSAPAFDLRAVVLGLALTTFCAVQSFAQTGEPVIPQPIDTTLIRDVSPLVLGKVALDYFDHHAEKQVSGTVFNSTNDFKTVFVYLKDADGKPLKMIRPDSKGKFAIDLDWKQNPTYLEFAGEGYESQVLYFYSMPSLSDIQVHLLDVTEMIRGEVIKGDVIMEKK